MRGGHQFVFMLQFKKAADQFCPLPHYNYNRITTKGLNMREIKCPKCGTVFTVDESGYAEIVSQIRNAEFEKAVADQIHQHQTQMENEIKLMHSKPVWMPVKKTNKLRLLKPKIKPKKICLKKTKKLQNWKTI